MTRPSLLGRTPGRAGLGFLPPLAGCSAGEGESHQKSDGEVSAPSGQYGVRQGLGIGGGVLSYPEPVRPLPEPACDGDRLEWRSQWDGVLGEVGRSGLTGVEEGLAGTISVVHPLSRSFQGRPSVVYMHCFSYWHYWITRSAQSARIS